MIQGGQKTRMAQSGPKVISPNMALTYVFFRFSGHPLRLLVVDRSFQLNTSDGHGIYTFHDGRHLVQSPDKPTEALSTCRLLS